MYKLLSILLTMVIIGCYDKSDDLPFEEVKKLSEDCIKLGGTPLKLGIDDRIVSDNQQKDWGSMSIANHYDYVFNVKCVYTR